MELLDLYIYVTLPSAVTYPNGTSMLNTVSLHDLNILENPGKVISMLGICSKFNRVVKLFWHLLEIKRMPKAGITCYF